MKITQNVVAAISSMSDKVGNFSSDRFSREIAENMEDHKIDSPIEQILYCALESMCLVCGLGNPPQETITGNIFHDGVIIKPQHQIGKYRADFMVSYAKINLKGIGEQVSESVIVECDGHDFHDKDEKQRRYEKKRDRDMQNMGFKVFRFTGAEIVKNPYSVAAEILAAIVGTDAGELISNMENL